MTVLEMLTEMISSEELFGSIAFAEFMDLAVIGALSAGFGTGTVKCPASRLLSA